MSLNTVAAKYDRTQVVFARAMVALALFVALVIARPVQAQQEGQQLDPIAAAETSAWLSGAALTLADVGADYQVRPGNRVEVVRGLLTHTVIMQREVRGIFSPGPLAVLGTLSTRPDGLPDDAFDRLVQELSDSFNATGRAWSVTGPSIGERTVWLQGEQEIAQTPANFHTVAFVAADTVAIVSVGGFPERVSQEDAVRLAGLVATRLGGTPTAPPAAVVQPPASVTSPPIDDQARATAHYDLGNRYARAGTHLAALAEFEQAAALRPDLPAPHLARGEALRELGRYEEALGAFDRAVALDPVWAEAHYGRGITLSHLDRHDEALAADDKATELAPENSTYAFARAHELSLLGRHREALAAIDRTIELSPRWADAFYNRGIMLEQLGDVDEAVSSYRRAIALNERYPEAHHNMGLLLLQQGHYEEALAAHTQARNLRPTAPAFHHGRGDALLRLHRNVEALDAFEQLVALSPNFARGHYERGMALVTLQRLDEARVSLRRAITLDPALERRISAALGATHADLLREIVEAGGD